MSTGNFIINHTAESRIYVPESKRRNPLKIAPVMRAKTATLIRLIMLIIRGLDERETFPLG